MPDLLHNGAHSAFRLVGLSVALTQRKGAAMIKHTSQRLANIELSATYAILDKVQELRAAGIPIVDLGGGEPDFNTPSHINEAAILAIIEGFTHYTSSRGLPALLDAIAQKLANENGVVVNPRSDIIVTPSAKHALFISLMALLNPGDQVIIPTPSWVSYKSMVQLNGAYPVEVPLRSEDNFSISLNALETKITPRTKVILVNSPNNPTGRVLSYEEASLIVEFAKQHDLIILSDEIYEKIVYDDSTHVSLASIPGAAERTLTINGFSKAYAMTGWRLGYVAGPADIIGEILKVQQHSVGCASSFVQFGGISALQGDQQPLVSMRESYAKRRKLIVDGLNAIPGISCRVPDGTFYAFADIRGTDMNNSVEFCDWLLRKARVAVTPGTAFGSGGEGHIRLSFATSSEVISDAVNRIRNGVLAHAESI
jgi:aspartate aminotransferase